MAIRTRRSVLASGPTCIIRAVQLPNKAERLALGSIALGTVTLGTIAFAFVAMAWLWLLRSYGFQVEDEGTLLFQFERVLRGQRPYIDFHTGYTPGYFEFGRASMAWLGDTAMAVRTVLAFSNVITATALYAITRRVAAAWVAPLPALVWLAFVPAYAGEFAAFNIPYPTWPATTAWMLVALAMLAWSRRGSLLTLVLAGAACALALCLRPDAGAFALAGSTWAVCATSTATRGIDRLARWAGAAFMAAGVWYTFQFQVLSADAFVHLLPTVAIAFLAASWPVHRTAVGRPAAAGALSVLAISFLVPTVAWMAPLYSALGHDVFLREVLLVGADYQSLYFTAHPMPQLHSAALAAGVLGIAVLGRAVIRQAITARLAAATVVVATIAAFIAALSIGLAPEGTLHAVSSQLENAGYWLALLANFGAIVFLVRKRVKTTGEAEASEQLTSRVSDLLVITPLAVAMYLQLYPRSDFMHQITAVPLTAVLAAVLLDRVSQWWSGSELSATLVRGFVWTVAVIVLAVETGPVVAASYASWQEPAPMAAMPRRLNVHVETEAEDELAELQRTVTWLRQHTQAGEPVLSFPATSGVLFAAELSNPSPHDYWFPGRPDHDEEQRVLGLLEAKPPRFVVTVNRHWTFFSEAPSWFSAMREFVVANYSLAMRAGRYDVLVRNDLPEASEPAAILNHRPETPHEVALQAAIEPDLTRRRQAARRWMETITANDAQIASLPETPRDAVLLLRAIRDGGDLRAAAWAVAGFASEHPRIRGEAVGAMEQLAKEHAGSRLRLANDYDEAALQPYVSGLGLAAEKLLAFERTRPFAQSILEIETK